MSWCCRPNESGTRRPLTTGLGRRVRLGSLPLTACMAMVLGGALLAVQGLADSAAPARDPYARFIARSEAIVLARVEYVNDDVPVLVAGGMTRVCRARFDVEGWVVGSDTARVLQFDAPTFTEHTIVMRTLVPGNQVLLYLTYLTYTEPRWYIGYDLAHAPDEALVGIELLSDAQVERRTADVRAATARLSVDSLACAAEVVAVGTLFTTDEPTRFSWHFQVDSTIVGSLADSVVSVVTTHPLDLLRGRALLMLNRRANGSYEVVREGLGLIHIRAGVRRHTRMPLAEIISRVRAARGIPSASEPR
jgi:hypothetical protein